MIITDKQVAEQAAADAAQAAQQQAAIDAERAAVERVWNWVAAGIGGVLAVALFFLLF